mmetsp:Transcript_24321/g.29418  ORF Transcript_24321/g.29418 Transcript_24321/m.29418 type:complete len:116 (+) Transcript_24321:524-871(+)
MGKRENVETLKMYERKEVKWVKNIHKSKQEVSNLEDKDLEMYKDEPIREKFYKKEKDDNKDSEYICSDKLMERCWHEKNANKDKLRPQAKYDKDENQKYYKTKNIDVIVLYFLKR